MNIIDLFNTQGGPILLLAVTFYAVLGITALVLIFRPTIGRVAAFAKGAFLDGYRPTKPSSKMHWR